jgi:hypothetical protein
MYLYHTCVSTQQTFIDYVVGTKQRSDTACPQLIKYAAAET